MRNVTELELVSEHELRAAINEIFPDSNYGEVPVIDQFDAVEAFRAFDDGGLAEVPSAYAAYLNSQGA